MAIDIESKLQTCVYITLASSICLISFVRPQNVMNKTLDIADANKLGSN